MVLTTLTLALTVGMATLEEKPLVCPINGGEVTKESPAVEYAGATYTFCCPGCNAPFTKDPQTAIKDNVKKGNTIGVFLFDPVSGERIVPKDAKTSFDYMSTRYYFSSMENRTTFEKNSKKLAVVPKKESLTCAVAGDVIENYSKAIGFVDHEGVRYYICCGMCLPKMQKEPAKYAGNNIGVPAVMEIVKK